MALTERGKDNPDKGIESDDTVQEIANTLGVKGFEQKTTEEERIEQIREHGGDEAVLSAELMRAGVTVYEKMGDSPGDQGLQRQFYQIVKALAALGPKALETVMATSLITAGELRKQMRKNGN